MLLSSTSSHRTLMVDVKLVLSHSDFHLSTIFITLRPNCDISMSILYKRIFLILSSPVHIHVILKLAPAFSQKSEKIHFVRTFCSSTTKTSMVTPIFLVYNFNKDSASFQWEKNWHIKSMFSFLAILAIVHIELQRLKKRVSRLSLFWRIK